MEKLELIKDYAKSFKLNYLNGNASKIIESADHKDLSYQDLILDILKNEIYQGKAKVRLIVYSLRALSSLMN